VAAWPPTSPAPHRRPPALGRQHRRRERPQGLLEAGADINAQGAVNAGAHR